MGLQTEEKKMIERGNIRRHATKPEMMDGIRRLRGTPSDKRPENTATARTVRNINSSQVDISPGQSSPVQQEPQPPPPRWTGIMLGIQACGTRPRDSCVLFCSPIDVMWVQMPGTSHVAMRTELDRTELNRISHQGLSQYALGPCNAAQAEHD